MWGNEAIDWITNHLKTLLEILFLGLKLPSSRNIINVTTGTLRRINPGYETMVSMSAGVGAGVFAVTGLSTAVAGLVYVDAVTSPALVSPLIYAVMKLLIVLGTAAIAGATCWRIYSDLNNPEVSIRVA